MPRPHFGTFGGAWSVEQGHVPEAVEVHELRRREKLSQAAFAKRYGFSEASVRDWEQGRRKPGRSARILLAVLRCEPEAVRRALAADPLS